MIYGRHPVLEALRAGAEVRRVLLQDGGRRGGIIDEIVAEATRRGVPVERLPRQRLDRAVEAGANHQGVAAELPPFRYTPLDQLLARAEERGEPPFLLLLDGIQDVHNLGALLRSAEAAGMHGAILPERRAAAITPAVYRTSAGAVHYLPIAQVTNLSRAIERLKGAGLWIAGLDMGGEPLARANLTGPLAIVVGAEGRGLGRIVAEHCDFLVQLPMRGQIDSLNASVAGAVLVYEALRQREAE